MKIGFTASAFDLCHAGHMMMLKEAKEHCDLLIVGLQDDPSNSRDVGYREKIKNKPIMSLEERKTILEGVKYVDHIFTYADEADLYAKLKEIKIDVRFLGDDWRGKKYTGWDLPHEPYFVDRSHGYSTSELRMRVYHAERERLEAISRQMPRKPGVLEKIANAISGAREPSPSEKAA